MHKFIFTIELISLAIKINSMSYYILFDQMVNFMGDPIILGLLLIKSFFLIDLKLGLL
jgi:hypothetical protein